MTSRELRNHLRPSLETASHLAFIVACAVLSAVVVWQYFGAPSRREAREGVGKDTSLPAEHVLRQRPGLTVYVEISSGCHYCTESMPFYSRLANEAQRSHGRVTVVFGSGESIATTIRYLENNGVHAPVAVSAPGDLPVKGTPTLFVIGRMGTILNGWLGRLSHRQEEIVLSFLRGKTAS